jgi:hypothetical protein
MRFDYGDWCSPQCDSHLGARPRPLAPVVRYPLLPPVLPIMHGFLRGLCTVFGLDWVCSGSAQVLRTQAAAAALLSMLLSRAVITCPTPTLATIPPPPHARSPAQQLPVITYPLQVREDLNRR